MKKKSCSDYTTALHEMAVRLCEGGQVYYLGHFWTAKVVETDDFPCDVCEAYSVCHIPLIDLCAEVDRYNQKNHILVMDGGE